jgi:chemotaxis response regulator CheB
MMVRIVVADDHEILWQGMRRILEEHSDWNVCAEAAIGEKAVTFAGQLNPVENRRAVSSHDRLSTIGSLHQIF